MQLQSPWASPEVVDRILGIGREALPAEACGIVTPDLRVVVLPNRHPTSTRDAFVIEAEDMVNPIVEFIERSGVDPQLVGQEHFMVWHTHPGGFVGPSQADLDARFGDFLYLVVTLPDGPATRY